MPVKFTRSKPALAGRGMDPSLSVYFFAFSKHNADDLTRKLGEGAAQWEGTHEQQAVWKAMAHSSEHLMVRAGAGTGKSSTMVEGMGRKGTRVATTMHSFGYRVVRDYFGRKVERNDNKVYDTLDRMGIDRKSSSWFLRPIVKKLVGYVKNYNVDSTDFDTITELAIHHSMEVNDFKFRSALPCVPRVMEAAQQDSSCIDADDMLWLPIHWNLPLPKIDVAIVDEAQDTNAIQREWLVRLAGNGTRLMLVGDEFQAIFGFRGADADAMHNIEGAVHDLRHTGTEETVIREWLTLPLSITQRCTKRGVVLANAVLKHIGTDFRLQAAPNAKEGSDEVVERCEAKAGDLIVCRLNRPLVPAAYDLLKRGQPCVIKGRDFGDGLVKTVEQVGGMTRDIFLHNLKQWLEMQRAVLIPQGERADTQLQMLEEKYDCILEFAKMVRTDDDPPEWVGKEVFFARVKGEIEKLFSDNINQSQMVTLGTVHRTKGLEAETVWVVEPGAMPMKTVIRGRKEKPAWEKRQELHLLYVAVTRSKDKIKFVGGVPSPLQKVVKDEWFHARGNNDQGRGGEDRERHGASGDVDAGVRTQEGTAERSVRREHEEAVQEVREKGDGDPRSGEKGGVSEQLQTPKETAGFVNRSVQQVQAAHVGAMAAREGVGEVGGRAGGGAGSGEMEEVLQLPSGASERERERILTTPPIADYWPITMRACKDANEGRQVLKAHEEAIARVERAMGFYQTVGTFPVGHPKYPGSRGFSTVTHQEWAKVLQKAVDCGLEAGASTLAELINQGWAMEHPDPTPTPKRKKDAGKRVDLTGDGKKPCCANDPYEDGMCIDCFMKSLGMG